ncbi:UDP-3-O-(3-hydroxymyristoyl)glucosamine N-acyltransferase [Rhodobacterales bacterium 52_120_T64]|nr:UDP-3-O-(3-hydroxymyristoyl)glucosamine N-acyltransferase [Rhodobacterales bacterium 52_120_T64]
MQITVAELAQALGAKAVGDVDHIVSGPCEPTVAVDGLIALAMDESYAEALQQSNASAAILWQGADWQGLGLRAAIFVPRPRYALSGITTVFDIEPEIPKGIHPSAIVDASAIIGKNPSVGPFVVIGKGARIGANARILAHASIAENAQIGANALIFEGVRIRARVVIGNDFICQPNAVIGGDGFSFVTPEAGAIEEARSMSQELTGGTDEYARINSLGTVVIGDRVEVGANTTIDRGTISNTVIGTGTKIDNLVQVGHNVKVGKHCLLCGMAGIAGSAVLHDRVILGGNAGVMDHVIVGANSIATGKAAILSNVPPNRVMMGNPAVPMKASIESYKALRRLPRLARKLAELQKQVSKLDTTK